MEIMQVVGIGIVAASLIAVIRVQRPEIAMQISIAAGVIMFLMVCGSISQVLRMLMTYASKIDIDIQYIAILLKIIGIAYIVEFGAVVCKDAGEAAIASKIEFAGRVVLAAMSIPILQAVLDMILKI